MFAGLVWFRAGFFDTSRGLGSRASIEVRRPVIVFEC